MPTTMKPLVPADWTSAQPTQIAQPPASLQASGFTAGQRPTYQHLNFLLYNIGQWISWLDQNANGAVSTLEIQQSMRLVTSAVWSYSASSGTLSWSDVFALSTPSIADSQNTVPAGSVAIAPGQIAYVVANLPFATTANITSGSTQLTSVSYEVGIAVGQTVTGNGIPAGTSVVAISGTTVTMSNAATASSSASVVTFVANATLSVQVANVANLQPAPNVIIIASVTPMYAIVGVNSGQMRLYDGEQKRLLNSGFIHTFMTQAGFAFSAGQAVYLSPGGGDVDNFQATTQAGSPTLTNVTSTANIVPGSSIFGAGIASGATVTAVGASSLSLSIAATSSGTAVSLQSQRIAGAAYPADTSRLYGYVRGNVAGIVTTTITLSASAVTPVRYLTGGTLSKYTGLTPGALYYADPTNPGGITTTLPNSAAYLAPIGTAVSATALYVQTLAMPRPPTADSVFNDVIVQPISGATNAVGVKVVNSAQATQFVVDNAGNIVANGAATIQGNVTAPSFTSGVGFKTVVGNGTLSNVTLNANTGSATILLDASGVAYTYVATHAGSIVGISGYNLGAATVQGGGAGATYYLAKNGTIFINGPAAAFNGGVANTTYPKGTYTFAPGDYIQLYARASGTSNVANVYVHASFVVELGA